MMNLSITTIARKVQPKDNFINYDLRDKSNKRKLAIQRFTCTPLDRPYYPSAKVFLFPAGVETSNFKFEGFISYIIPKFRNSAIRINAPAYTIDFITIKFK